MLAFASQSLRRCVMSTCERTHSADGARGAQDDAPSDRRGAADGARAEADEIAKRRRQHMIRIAINAEAFEAIARTLRARQRGLRGQDRRGGRAPNSGKGDGRGDGRGWSWVHSDGRDMSCRNDGSGEGDGRRHNRPAGRPP